jgi:hypothetical protein
MNVQRYDGMLCGNACVRKRSGLLAPASSSSQSVPRLVGFNNRQVCFRLRRRPPQACRHGRRMAGMLSMPVLALHRKNKKELNF